MKNQLTYLLLFMFLFSSQIMASEKHSYDWLTLGKKSGEQIVTSMDDGSIHVAFNFNDRGRGPDSNEIIQLNAKGMMISYQASGKSYMGAPIEESFSFKDDKAIWKSDGENGSQAISEKFAYVAANSTPETMAILIRWISSQPSKSIKLLPSGTASIKTLLTTTVTTNNKEKTVKLVALSGLGFTPSYVWFDEKEQLFAVAYGWMGMTVQGWSSTIDTLQKLQDQADEDFHKNLSKELTQSIAKKTLINNVNIVDVKTGQLQTNSAVFIENGIITALGKNAKNMKASQVIDGKGKTLMPGLWDMHTHIGLADGLLQIAAGITSVRDLANKHEDLIKTIDAFDTARVIGPHVYKAGFIDQKSPFSAPTGKLADNLQQALEFVDWYAERQYPQIKIYSSITPQWVKPIAERIHKHGMRLSGHIPSYMTTEQAVKDGFDEIQHINMLFLNFIAGPDDDTRTPLRFTLVGEKAGDLDLDSTKVKDFIKLLKQNNVVVDPTVTIFHSMFLNKSGEIDPSYAMIADHLPASVRRGFLASSLEINDNNENQYKKSSQALLLMIKKLHEAGVQLVAGTDAIAGFTLHRELELYVKAGISNKDVIKIATLDSARVAGMDKTSGSIEVGKAADLILLDGNPIKDISSVRKVLWTMKNGQIYDAAKLYRAIGIAPFTDS